jgi:aryl-alcohol dehydrogenase-like predicted oxidoreductase
VLADPGVLAELAGLRAEGLCIGLTVTGPRQADTIRRALEVRLDGVPLFDSVQATWNVLEPSAGVALADAKAEGWGVIVKEVLANGRLTNRNAGPAMREVRAHAARLGTTIEALAIAAAVAQPWTDVVLSGALTCEQLQHCLAALHLRTAVPPIAQAPELYWQQRAALRWT